MATRKTSGRPTKYAPTYCRRLITFFSRPPYRDVTTPHPTKSGETSTMHSQEPNDPPYFSAFARSIGVHRDSLLEWARVHPEFQRAMETAKQLQEEFLVTNCLRQLTNPAMSIFFLKNNHGYRDRFEHEHSGSDGEPIRLLIASQETRETPTRLSVTNGH